MEELCSKARDAPKSNKELGLDVSLMKFGSEPEIYFQIKIPALVSEYKILGARSKCLMLSSIFTSCCLFIANFDATGRSNLITD